MKFLSHPCGHGARRPSAMAATPIESTIAARTVRATLMLPVLEIASPPAPVVPGAVGDALGDEEAPEPSVVVDCAAGPVAPAVGADVVAASASVTAGSLVGGPAAEGGSMLDGGELVA